MGYSFGKSVILNYFHYKIQTGMQVCNYNSEILHVAFNIFLT